MSNKAPFMKPIEKSDLDYFLELPLVAGLFLGVDGEYLCIHDDNEGYSDQCLRIALKEYSNETEVFHVHTPVMPGLRFRNYAGGGSSIPVHNALKVLIYATFKQDELLLPGLDREIPYMEEIFQNILDGIIVLPPEVFANKENLPHYFFELIPGLKLAIAVDGDTHIIAEPNTEVEKLIKGETTRWNPEPFVFDPNSNCSRAIYNALILLTLATEQGRN